MERNNNTTKTGGSWTEKQIKEVWRKGQIIPKYDPNVWRWDVCGSVMNFEDHGNRDSDYGWEIDHIDPVVNGGGDELENLQPMNWKNNAKKADTVDWECS